MVDLAWYATQAEAAMSRLHENLRMENQLIVDLIYTLFVKVRSHVHLLHTNQATRCGLQSIISHLDAPFSSICPVHLCRSARLCKRLGAWCSPSRPTQILWQSSRGLLQRQAMLLLWNCYSGPLRGTSLSNLQPALFHLRLKDRLRASSDTRHD